MQLALRNRWNQWVYACWSPVYDWLIQLPPYRQGRKLLWHMAAAEPGEKILLVGVGTGSDFDELPADVDVHALDISPAMLRRANRKATALKQAGFTGQITLVQGDAQNLPFDSAQFDLIIFALIVSVVADPQRCLQEAVRVTKPNGRLLILDKFLPENTPPTWRRRLANLLTRPCGTDINRHLEPLIRPLPLSLTRREHPSPDNFLEVIELRTAPAPDVSP